MRACSYEVPPIDGLVVPTVSGKVGRSLSVRFRTHRATSRSPDLYSAALDMSAWVDSCGASGGNLCEHHMSPDGWRHLRNVVEKVMPAVQARTAGTL